MIFCKFVQEINPMYVTIKIENKEMYYILVQYLKSLKIQIVSEEPENENEVWNRITTERINQAYSLEEPDYDTSMIKEPNSDYEGR